MKKIIFQITVMSFALTAAAQKKLVPVTQSSVAGITLPQGSKKDGRMLVELAGKSLLQMEAKKTGASIKSIEVLYLPLSFNTDSLNQVLSSSGWTITPSAADNSYLWLQKDGHSLLAYFASKKEQAELYFGEANGTAQQIVNNDAGMQNQNTQQGTGIDNAAQNQNTQTQSQSQTDVQTPMQQPALQDMGQPAISDGYSFTTTNFDDGWTSVVQTDWVLVSNADMKVYLCYALPFEVNKFTGTGLRERDYYWDNYITQYFNVETKQYKDDGEVIGSLQPKYVEGWATDKQTGERRFVAMYLAIAPNTAYLTVASAKDEASLRRQFPTANGTYSSDLAAMSRYNKFAIAENDVIGQWQKGNSSTAQWYYVSPGGYESYAGMAVAATSSTFNFNSGGNYTSIHNGATGAVGALNTFQQNYKGNYTVTNWTITATNRFEGRTAIFNAWFETVRGGRILHLQDQQYTSDQEQLVKTK